MVSKSFCLDDLRVDTKILPIVIDQQPLTPQIYQSFQTNQGKEFLQLYIKARSQDRDGKPKQKLNPQQSSDSDRKAMNNENEYKIANEPYSPYVERNSCRRKVILKDADTNCMPKGFTSERPSKFKLNHQVDKLDNEQQEKDRSFTFKLDQANHESLHYIETKDIVEPNQGPTSIEILLPIRNDTQVRESYVLEVQNTNEQEIIQEQENQQEQEIENRPENQTHHDLRTIEIVNSPPALRRITFGPHIERAFYKILKIYTFMFASYGILLGINYGIFPYYLAFLLAWGIEAYLMYESYFQGSQQYDPSANRERITFCFQLVSLAIFQTLGLLRLSGISFPLSLGMICNILVLIVSCYLMNARNARDSARVNTLFHTLLIIQLLSICLKVDGVIQWNWRGTFWISWAVLAVAAFYCFGLFMMFMFYLCIENGRNYQLMGLTWVLSGFCGFIVTVFTLLLGFTNKLETGVDTKLIQIVLLGGLGHVVFMTLLTLFAKNKIKSFLQKIVRPDPQREEEVTPEVRFEKDTERLPPYIIRFTPSYFLTFAQSLKDKDGTRLRNTKKKLSIAKSFQYRRTKPELSLKPYILQTATEKNYSPSINKLRQIFFFNNELEAKTPLYFKPKPTNFASEIKRKFQKAEEDSKTLPEVDDGKLCFSANDMDFIKKIETCDFLADIRAPTTPCAARRPSSEKDDDKACIICFDRFPDAVVMGCGHGGICYECALESWKKSEECFMCRAKIEKVLHIDTNQKGNLNIRKVLSATKLAKDRSNGLAEHEENFSESLYVARNHL